ncbi:MAG: biotin/lipoyl-binding protein, partial [Candidatus Gastranaerophilales bacterium]|nr:biotin/lipoyl-binding protein [Candidatus Gastranaerophilales bacterium]
MKKKIIIIFLIFLLIGLIFFLLFFKKKNINVIKTYGNIEIRQVDLSFQVSGIIKDVLVEEGDYVKKGDILAK